MTKKSIRYTVLVEGIAEGIFIPLLLKRMGLRFEISFSASPIRNIKKANKERVISRVEDVAKASLIANNDDLLIVGVDLDAPDYPPELEKHKTQVKMIVDRIPKTLRVRSIVFVPIQAIDFWLLYQLESKGPRVVNSLESKSKTEVKKELYCVSSPDRYKIEQTVSKVMANFDADRLSKQSASFKHFYTQLNSFCGALG